MEYYWQFGFLIVLCIGVVVSGVLVCSTGSRARLVRHSFDTLLLSEQINIEFFLRRGLSGLESSA